MKKTLFDLDGGENFDLFFANLLPHINPIAKEAIPKDISFKLFRNGGDVNPKNTSKLGFIAKLYILWRCLRKRWWIVVEDEENGLSIEDFVKLREAIKKRDYGTERADDLVSSGTFVTGSKELSNAFSYLNYLSASPAYNYLVKGKNKIPNKSAEHERHIQYLFRFLSFYESQKKKFVSDTGISIPEFYVLAATYHGKEMKSSLLHTDIYKRAYQSNPSRIKAAVRSLCGRGYMEKFGSTNNSVVRITTLGKDAIRQISAKYILNC